MGASVLSDRRPVRMERALSKAKRPLLARVLVGGDAQLRILEAQVQLCGPHVGDVSLVVCSEIRQRVHQVCKRVVVVLVGRNS